jgi:hypothetical protein
MAPPRAFVLNDFNVAADSVRFPDESESDAVYRIDYPRAMRRNAAGVRPVDFATTRVMCA